MKKTKEINKLQLKKSVIASLNDNAMQQVVGGDAITKSWFKKCVTQHDPLCSISCGPTTCP